MRHEMSTYPLKLAERGIELVLVDWGGEGPLALFAHANGFCAAPFEPIARALRTRYRVFGYDARGHGDSSTPPPPEPYEWEEFVRDLIAVARALTAELGVARVALGLGHSFGGTCTLAAAARHPELFARVAVLDPVISPPVGEREGYYAGLGEHPLAEIARKRTEVFDSREAIQRKWSERGTFGDWDPRALDLYLAHGFRDRADGTVELKCPGSVEAAVYEAGPNFDLFAEIAALRTPSTYYWAEEGAVQRALAERFAAASPALELEPLAMGHLVPMIAPDEVSQKLLAL